MLQIQRRLKDLVSIGPIMLENLALLAVVSIRQLSRRNPKRMYEELCRLKRQRLDACCLDVFVAAVAQAKDLNLPIEQRQWWRWSKMRKGTCEFGLRLCALAGYGSRKDARSQKVAA